VQIAPQRAVILLPSTGQFDSRTWRIAGDLARRGHTVTVLARSGRGLPDVEAGPSGSRIIRVPVSAVDGLPSPLRAIARRLGRGSGRAGSGAPASSEAAHSGLRSPGHAARGPAPGPATGPIARVRRAVAGAWRLAAIGLTIRSQVRAARRVAPPADLVHAMAYMGIPVGLALGARDGAVTIYDARDIYTDARNIARLPRPLRSLFARIERRWARSASRVITVNDPYADVMAERFGPPRPLVVMNCSAIRPDDAPRRRRFHEVLDLPSDRRVILYHGGLSPDRGIDQLLAAIGSVPDALLVLMGYGDLELDLRRRAADPATGGRIAVLPAVPPAELIEWVAAADVVAMPIQPTTLNHRLTTPNKLFEAIAAGVPVVASDLPGMAGIIRDTGCGDLVDPTDPAAIAAAFRDLLDPSAERQASLAEGIRRARATYSWDRQMAVLLAEYSRLTGRPW
jgi:glycosyltransferase involved in cell wall biosynthesis